LASLEFQPIFSAGVEQAEIMSDNRARATYQPLTAVFRIPSHV
jgi:hypothetical protein